LSTRSSGRSVSTGVVPNKSNSTSAEAFQPLDDGIAGLSTMPNTICRAVKIVS